MLESLMRGATQRARRLTWEFSDESSEMLEPLNAAASEPEKYQEAYKTYAAATSKLAAVYGKKTAVIERETLADMLAVLSPDQIKDGWPVFERSRRRLLMAYFQSGGSSGPQPMLIVRAMKLAEPNAAAVAPVLDQYELQVDALIKGGLLSIRAAKEKAAEGVIQEHEAWLQAFKARDVLRLNVQTIHKVAALLDEPAREQLMLQRVAREIAYAFQRPSTLDYLLGFTKVAGLTAEQRTQMETLFREADERVLSAAKSYLSVFDDWALGSDPEGDSDLQKRYAEHTRATSAGLQTLYKSLRNALTPEQLDAMYIPDSARGDAFKQERDPTPDSTWLSPAPTTPTKPAK